RLRALGSGLGESFVVTAPEEAAEAATRLRRYIESPVLTGIAVQFSGFDAYDVEPRKIPDLFASRRSSSSENGAAAPGDPSSSRGRPGASHTGPRSRLPRRVPRTGMARSVISGREPASRTSMISAPRRGQ